MVEPSRPSWRVGTVLLADGIFTGWVEMKVGRAMMGICAHARRRINGMMN